MRHQGHLWKKCAHDHNQQGRTRAKNGWLQVNYKWYLISFNVMVAEKKGKKGMQTKSNTRRHLAYPAWGLGCKKKNTTKLQNN